MMQFSQCWKLMRGEPYKIELNPDNSEKVTTIQDFGWVSTFS